MGVIMQEDQLPIAIQKKVMLVVVCGYLESPKIMMK